jgi:hypothetical protein
MSHQCLSPSYLTVVALLLLSRACSEMSYASLAWRPWDLLGLALELVVVLRAETSLLLTLESS